MTLTRIWRALSHWRGIPEGEATVCQYEPCSTVVTPHNGWRDGFMVFCSGEHAMLDQEEHPGA